MINKSKYGKLNISNSEMEYVRFGYGEKAIIILPGLGESLRSLKGTALPMSLLYQKLSKGYTVFVLSRISPMPEEYSTCDMANDTATAMSLLGIPRADVVGVSMGGMIAQHQQGNGNEQQNKCSFFI